ncbi:hypothetical protein DER45DRAFT_614182 [Fusarium avenaceum]|nr:hypothetical protein DER45DRAFT_614182 [Fusarium avenaceum]
MRDYSKFAGMTVNKTSHHDTWSWTGRKNNPLDQPTVVVGGASGWLLDGAGLAGETAA